MCSLQILIVLLHFGIFIPQTSFSQEVSSSPADLIIEGDRHWERRADGADGSHANPAEIGRMISAYHKAMSLKPGSLAAGWRLMRGLYFKGEYESEDVEIKKRIFSEGKTIGEEALARVVEEASRIAGKPVPRDDPIEVARLMGDAPDLRETLFWLAVHWGKWALAYGKIQAARQGAATRIRDLASAVIEIDPAYEGGGGYRVLGRLHHQTPAIPFITGWASTQEALRNLRLAMEFEPTHFLNRLYLAEALWDKGGEGRAEAVRLIEEIVQDAPRPDSRIEDRRVQEVAATLLEKWKKGR